MKTKRCSKCDQDRPIGQFSTRKNKHGQLYSWCRECVKEQGKDWRKRNPVKNMEAVTRWRNRNPEAMKAQNMIHRAIESGRIVRSNICAHADSTCSNSIQAHHWHGYDEAHWLDVIWLCGHHHRILHYQEQEQL